MKNEKTPQIRFRGFTDLPASRQAIGKWCIYVLECNDGSLYKGKTNDLARRINEHLSGTGAEHTKKHKPIRLVYFQTFQTEKEALDKEQYLKSGSGREWLKNNLTPYKKFDYTRKLEYDYYAWEQRELGEVAKKITEKNTNSLYNETFTNSAEHGIISQRDFFDHDITNADNINIYYIVENEDFVYNPRISNFAPVGPINRNKLGRNGVMSPLYTVFRTENMDYSFLEQFFRSDGWHSYMRLNGDTGARSDRFSIKDDLFFEMPIPFPKIEEQTKIGTFFKTLDNLITCHQREPTKLRRYLC